MKAGRDCDRMDTCGGSNLLGTYVKGVLYLDDKQYCGNGFGCKPCCKKKVGRLKIWELLTLSGRGRR